jgi:hypothetical protein
VTVTTEGTFTYSPNSGYVGTDSFTFTANDGDVNSDAATVTITVNAPVPAPAITRLSTLVGRPGRVVTIDGQYFTGVTGVKFNTTSVPAGISSSWR